MKKQLITVSMLAMAGIVNAQWTGTSPSPITTNQNVGIGTATPGQKLDVAGSIKFSGSIMPNGVAGTPGQVLMSGGSGATPAWTNIGGTLSGGFANYIPKWGSSSALAGVSLLYDNGVNVGVNNTSPSQRFHVTGDTRVDGKLGINCAASAYGSDISILGLGGSASIMVMNNNTSESYVKVGNGLTSYKFYIEGGGNYVGHLGNGIMDFLNFKQGSSAQVWFPGAAQVWVGDAKPQSPHADFKFAVDGKLVAQSLYITPAGSPNWADYVFAPDYKLPSLDDVEAYYKTNRHLPEIPSAKQIEERGIDVAEMNTLLLKKVEELTLYVVELKKEINGLKKKED